MRSTLSRFLSCIKHRGTLFLILFVIASTTGHGETRHALMIGNDSYPGNALTNARNDATGVYDELKAAGYASTLVLDADKATLSRKVDDFVETFHPGDTAIIYYAGHGMQVDGENFLIPVDFKLTSTDSAKEQAYSLSSVLERLTSHGATTQVVILDACRDNPFMGSRSMRGGWAGLGTSAGAFLAFGTSPGSTASDAPGEGHGLFTKSLLQYLTKSDLDVEEMFRKVRENVIRDSGGKQVPWVSSSLIGAYHFRPELDAKQPLLDVRESGDSVPSSEASRSLRDVAVGPPAAQALSSVPGMEREQLSEAATLVRGAKWGAAVGVLKQVLSIDPGCGSALRLLGLVFHSQGRDIEAITEFDRAVQVDKGDVRAASYKCALEGVLGLPEAERDCAASAAAQPSADAYLTLAGTEFAQGANDRAYVDATRSISLGGNDLSYALRGSIRSRQGHRDESEHDFSRAVKRAIEADSE